MITLKKLEWDNWYSYGIGNVLDLNSSNLTQVIGKNGSGKSSIIHILEEVLYNKNSKGIKKSDIMNRGSAYLSAKLYFSVDGIDYIIDIIRKNTLKISLYMNGEDISSHTATNTFKEIQNIIGIDFQTFTQLVHQNSKQGLEFLTSADAARKKFLITLFKLDRYTDYYDTFKNMYNELNLHIKVLEGKYSTINEWININSKSNLTMKEPVIVPDDSELKGILSKIEKLKLDLLNIDNTNKSIKLNNNNINALAACSKPCIQFDKPNSARLQEASNKLSVLNSHLNIENTNIKHLNSLGDGECTNCKQTINIEIKTAMLHEATTKVEELSEEINILNDEVRAITKYIKQYKEYEKELATYTKLENIINGGYKDLVSETLITNEIRVLNTSYKNIKASIDKAIKHNTSVATINSRVETILTELDRNSKDIKRISEELKSVESTKTNLEVLKSAFSTKGLVSYKIDYLIKDLQDKINEYLVRLSDGRFQLNFKLLGDNINIVIVDNGREVTITALSTGELSRVNVATLLAIRSLMSTLSNTKINFLFLDEIMSVLDEVGKNNLIDILLDENDLNTFIVDHSFSHPLLDKIYVNDGGLQ